MFFRLKIYRSSWNQILSCRSLQSSLGWFFELLLLQMKVINHPTLSFTLKHLTGEIKKIKSDFLFFLFFSSGLFCLYKVARTWGSEQRSNFLCWNLLKRFSFDSQKLKIIEMKNNCRMRFSLNVAKKCCQFSLLLNFSEGKTFACDDDENSTRHFQPPLQTYSSHTVVFYTLL